MWPSVAIGEYREPSDWLIAGLDGSNRALDTATLLVVEPIVESGKTSHSNLVRAAKVRYAKR